MHTTTSILHDLLHGKQWRTTFNKLADSQAHENSAKALESSIVSESVQADKHSGNSLFVCDRKQQRTERERD